MLLDGGGADCVDGPTNLEGSGGRKCFHMYALKLILVHSETNIINKNGPIPLEQTRQLQVIKLSAKVASQYLLLMQ